VIFRALIGLIDDYFNGYYSEEMIESQVIILVAFLYICKNFGLTGDSIMTTCTFIF